MRKGQVVEHLAASTLRASDLGKAEHITRATTIVDEARRQEYELLSKT